MSKWLVTLNWKFTTDVNGYTKSVNDTYSPSSRIYEFQNELPSEEEIKAILTSTNRYGETHHRSIVFMQKLG